MTLATVDVQESSLSRTVLGNDEVREIVNPGGVTYADVAAKVTFELQEANASAQVLANHASTYKRFLNCHGLAEDEPFGKELTVDFDCAVSTFFGHLQVLGRAPSTIRSQMTLLRRYRAVAESLMLMPRPKDFRSALKGAMSSAGWNVNQLSKESGVGISNIRNWTVLNREPVHNSLEMVRAVEAALRLPKNALVSCCSWAVKEESKAKRVLRPELAYRRTIKRLNSTPYRLRTVSESLREEWCQVLEFKSSFNAASEFNPYETWKFRELAHDATKRPWFASYDNRTSATAEQVFTLFCRYWGFLCLPRQEGGLGMQPEEMSLALLLHADGFSKFLDFIRRRAGVMNKTTTIAIGNLTSFLRKETGFVWIHTELLQSAPSSIQQAVAGMPGSTDKERWRQFCEAEHARWSKHLSRLQRARQIEVSRDPGDPIREVLASEQPLRYLVRAQRDFDASCPPAQREMQWAAHKRDALVFALLVATALRSKHISLLTWRDDNTGQLFQRPSGDWAIRIDRTHFKNHRGAASDREYEVTLARSISKRIDEYMELVRPLFEPRDEFVFLPYKRFERNIGRAISQEAVYGIVRAISEAFVPECHGFGPHAIRHIVATDWLKNHPGDYPTAALILHDKLETVLKHYSHLSANDGGRRYTSYIDLLHASVGKGERSAQTTD